VYATAGGGKESVTSAFPFVFTDWSIGLRSGGGTPEQWARANFWLQMTLSLLLAVAVVGGIALALRAADRAVRLSAMKENVHDAAPLIVLRDNSRATAEAFWCASSQA